MRRLDEKDRTRERLIRLAAWAVFLGTVLWLIFGDFSDSGPLWKHLLWPVGMFIVLEARPYYMPATVHGWAPAVPAAWSFGIAVFGLGLCVSARVF